MNEVRRVVLAFARDRWWKEIRSKPKLRTYVQVRMRDMEKALIKAKLERYQRSVLSKFLCGTLPIEIETGRYMGTPKEMRLCTVCRSGEVEDEFHLLYRCLSLQHVRMNFYRDNIVDPIVFGNLNEVEKKQFLMSPEKIHIFGHLVTALMLQRRGLLYKPS